MNWGFDPASCSKATATPRAFIHSSSSLVLSRLACFVGAPSVLYAFHWQNFVRVWETPATSGSAGGWGVLVSWDPWGVCDVRTLTGLRLQGFCWAPYCQAERLVCVVGRSGWLIPGGPCGGGCPLFLVFLRFFDLVQDHLEFAVGVCRISSNDVFQGAMDFFSDVLLEVGHER